jgi:hypothetical protein
VAVALTTGDFDEDGITDLAVVRQVAAGRVVVLRGQGSSGVGNGTFASGVSIPCGASPTSVLACDLNGNGVADLLIPNGSGAGTVTAMFGKGVGGVGDGSFEAPQTLPAGGDVEGLVLGDFDEDGSPDLAVPVAGGTLGVLLGRCPAATATGVTLLEPNGGEQWPVGTEQIISWAKGPAVPLVTIELSRDNGLNWETMATGQTGTSFAWTVTPPQAGSASALVRIYDPSVPGRSDASDAAFRIAAPTVGAPAGSPAAFGLNGVFPNPAGARFMVSFSLPGSGPARLELIDIAGRRIASREVGMLGPGSHAVDLGPRPLPPGGVYMVRLTRGGEQVTRKVVVVK